MPHGHGHDHDHGPSGKILGWMLVLSSTYMIAEIVGGWLSGSLALLADAGHMAADVAAMALGWSAIWLSRRPPNERKTYGYYRAEILAAMANASSLLFISVWILIEAYERLGEPTEVQGGMMAVVAAGGLVVNLIGLFLMAKQSKDSLNIRGVWLHLLTDTLGSVAALVGAFLVWQYGWYLADPIISIGIAALILFGAWSLLKRSVDVLLVGVPEGVSVEAIKREIESHRGVKGIHDLHVWSIRTGVNALSAHVNVLDEVDTVKLLSELTEALVKKHGIQHPTLQLEPPSFRNPNLVPCGVPV